ncbi:MAG: TIGR04013 family B12-binding domain/radical SAM domain-containing protein, partial [Euryarchaeota archaeon]|nr:TIGR04013 family B12-binding domain/radical SAM domain-containing protein [Euryarchaeota archaeon]
IRTRFSSRPQEGIMIYSFATPQAEEVYREIEGSKLRSTYIGGGPHPSAKPAEALQFFDFVVLGEGEVTLPDLIVALSSANDTGSVRGIAYKQGDTVLHTGARRHADLNMFPPFTEGLRSPIEISRGCPHACKYCQTPRLFGNTMRHRSVQSIAHYSRSLTDVRFISPNAFAYGSDGRHPEVSKVARLLESIQGNIYFGTFPSEVRPEFVTRELLELVTTYCANTSIHLGAQSGSDAILEEIGRGHSRHEVELALDLCRDCGITPVIDFIFGLPTETRADQLKSLDLIERIIAKKGKIRAHYFTPLPGTPYRDKKPSPVSPEVNKKLGKLARDGHLSGRWDFHASKKWETI